MIRALIVIFTLLTTQVTAQDRQIVFNTLWETHGGVLAGTPFAPTSQSDVSQYWDCIICTPNQTILIGLYDYAYTYDTTDPHQAMQMLLNACRFEDCMPQAYSLGGIDGYIMSGPRRSGFGYLSAFILGDRLLMLEIKPVPSQDRAAALYAAAETELLLPIITARP